MVTPYFLANHFKHTHCCGGGSVYFRLLQIERNLNLKVHRAVQCSTPRWWFAPKAWSWQSWTTTCRTTGFCDWDGPAWWPRTGCACWRWWSPWWTFCSLHRPPWWPSPQSAPWESPARPVTARLCCYRAWTTWTETIVNEYLCTRTHTQKIAITDIVIVMK